MTQIRRRTKGCREHQHRSQKNNATKRSRSHHRRRALVIGLFVVTLAAAIVHLLDLGHGQPLGQWCTFLAIVLPAWATAIHAVGKQLELERLAARSKQMAGVLERLVLSVEQARSIAELRAAVGEATRVVGLENHEWSVLLSFSPAELAV